MAAADIYRQYLEDYQAKAKIYNHQSKVYNENSKAYNDTFNYQGGPVNAVDAGGTKLGLYETPGENIGMVRTGSYSDYSSQYGSHSGDGNFNTVPAFTDTGDGRGTWVEYQAAPNKGALRTDNGVWVTEVGNGLSAARTGGKGTGEFVTYESRPGGENFAPTHDSYEVMEFPDAASFNVTPPAPFTATPPNLSLQQLREMENPTPSAAQIEREAPGVGLIENARKPKKQSAPSLSEGLIYGAKGA